MRLNALYSTLILLIPAVLFSEEGATERVLMGSADIVGQVMKMEICFLDRDGAAKFIREGGAALPQSEKNKVVTLTQNAARKMVEKAREATEASLGKKSNGGYIASIVLLSDKSTASFLVTDSDSVMLVKNSGEQGASYPVFEVYSHFKQVLEDERK